MLGIPVLEEIKEGLTAPWHCILMTSENFLHLQHCTATLCILCSQMSTTLSTGEPCGSMAKSRDDMLLLDPAMGTTRSLLGI
jgi:hypothetical protein